MPRKWSDRAIGGSGLKPLLVAVGAAALLPGCSCATTPMASGLKDTGAPRLGTTTAFIFMSPLLSPVTVVLTWAMLGWRMTAARVVAFFVESITLGLIVNHFEGWFSGSRPAMPDRARTTEGDDPVCYEACGYDAGGCWQSSRAAPRIGLALLGILRSVAPSFCSAC